MPGEMLSSGGAVLARALRRMSGRDSMLYVGGVSFFALLALFPGLTLLVTLYSLIAPPGRAAAEAAEFRAVLPPAAQALVHDEVAKILRAPVRSLGLQGAFSLLVGAYASHRGVKALLAGLQFIYAERRPRSMFEFNMLALVVGIAAFLIITVASSGFLAFRLAVSTLHLAPLKQTWLFNAWTWAGGGLTLGLTLLYRYAMASHPVSIRAAGLSGALAALLTLGASWLSALYVTHVVNLGAAYGSIGAVVVFLIWLSWNVNAVLFGAALTTEIEIALGEGAASDLPDAEPQTVVGRLH